MAIYVPLQKVAENDEMAEYRFAFTNYIPDEDEPGRNRPFVTRLGWLRLNKSDGEVIVTRPMPDDERNFVTFRAVAKLKKHWGIGEFPEKTCYAA